MADFDTGDYTPNPNDIEEFEKLGKKVAREKRQKNEKKQQPSEPKKREYLAYKYSNKGKGDLFESVILAGVPVFLRYDRHLNEIQTSNHIEEINRIIKPPSSEEYPYECYEFANIEEVHSYFDRAVTTTRDLLFQKAKSIVSKYNDQDEYKLILQTADIVWS